VYLKAHAQRYFHFNFILYLYFNGIHKNYYQKSDAPPGYGFPELNPVNLPRFNMPFELGLFFGATMLLHSSKSIFPPLWSKYVKAAFPMDLNGIFMRLSGLTPGCGD
jgi:hypothetical protein